MVVVLIRASSAAACAASRLSASLRACEQVGHPRPGAVQRRRVHVADDHPLARQRRDVRDVAAHDACADYSQRVDSHRFSDVRCPGPTRSRRGKPSLSARGRPSPAVRRRIDRTRTPQSPDDARHQAPQHRAGDDVGGLVVARADAAHQPEGGDGGHRQTEPAAALGDDAGDRDGGRRVAAGQTALARAGPGAGGRSRRASAWRSVRRRRPRPAPARPAPASAATGSAPGRRTRYSGDMASAAIARARATRERRGEPVAQARAECAVQAVECLVQRGCRHGP